MIDDNIISDERRNRPCSIQDIENFEQSNDLKFPPDYREYLLKFNGSMPKKTYWSSKESPHSEFRLDKLFGLHDGADIDRLDLNFAIKYHNNLHIDFDDRYKLIVVGVGGMGEYILIDLNLRGVFLLVPDFADGNYNFEKSSVIIKLTNTFAEFLDELVDKDDYINSTLSAKEQQAFNARLEKLRKQFDESQ